MSGVLVLGGYGVHGTRICELLARVPALAICVAGRRLEPGIALAQRLGTGGARPVQLDRDRADDVSAYLREQRPDVVIDAVGPFQGRDYGLAERVMTHGAHWIDLGDDRRYVTGITALDARARARGVLVTSGASTVPALSTAVVERLVADLDSLDSIELGISPGQRSPRGLATARSVLSYCGKPIQIVAPAGRTVGRGWSGLVRHRYPPPVGGRWLSAVDLPDIALLAEQYPGIESIELRAGLELSVLHLGLSLLSVLVARGWIASLEPAARLLRGVAGVLDPLGSAAGAMHVTVRGHAGGRHLARHWTLVAERDDGPYVPAAAASVLVKRLCGAPGYAPLAVRGARPCVGLVGIEEFLQELAGRAIRVVMRDELLA